MKPFTFSVPEFADFRGSLMSIRPYDLLQQVMPEKGSKRAKPPQIYDVNITFNKGPVFRGMHYQLPPAAVGKLLICLDGMIVDYAYPLDKSKLFDSEKLIVTELHSGEGIYVPEGYAHGHSSEEGSQVLYLLIGAKFTPASEAGFLLPEDFPLSGDYQLHLSMKDKNLPEYRDRRLK